MKIRVAVIDAELIGKPRHRFPNLASMKISGYHKELGDEVVLITEYNKDYLLSFDKIWFSVVFTDTPYPEWVLKLPNIRGGVQDYGMTKHQIFLMK